MLHSKLTDPRIVTNIEQLVRLQSQAIGFSFLPHHKAGSRLSGRHQSKFRGRGLNFEEFRHYLPGDDIRILDWRVTLRTKQPHVRVYSEEKDLPVILCVDQRQNMFFASKDTMKSVVAAELAAISAWRIQKDNDRVGALVFNEHGHQWFQPERSRDHVLRMLRGIDAYNHYLAECTNKPELIKAEDSFSNTLLQLSKLKLKNSVLVFLTDFKGLTEKSSQLLKQLQAHNDVLGVMISDPMELDIRLTSDFYASDGQLQVALPKADERLQAKFERHAKAHQRRVQELFINQDLPLVEVNTDGQHIAQFQQQIAGVVYAR